MLIFCAIFIVWNPIIQSEVYMYIQCEPKNTPKCFYHVVHKTQSILIKFGTHCAE